MAKEQLEFLKSEINRTYLFLLGHGDIDFKVIELMKWPAMLRLIDASGKGSSFPHYAS